MLVRFSPFLFIIQKQQIFPYDNQIQRKIITTNMDDNFGKKIVKGHGKFVKKYYTIKNQMNNQVIDLDYDQKNQEFAFFRGADHGQTQTFTFIRQGYDFYIKNKNQGHYLTVQSQENGANVYGGPKEKGNKRQLFRIQKKDTSDIIFIRTFCDKVLEVSVQGQGVKGHICQWKFTGEQNQQFKLVEPRAVQSSTDQGDNLYETKHGLAELKQVAK